MNLCRKWCLSRPARRIAEADLFDLRQAIAQGLKQLSDRDRRVLRAFYLEEKSKEEILKRNGYDRRELSRGTLPG